MRYIAIFVAVALLWLLLPSCGGGGGHELIVGFIEGPGVVDEGATAQFSVEANGDSGVSYLWSVVPASAGQFSDHTLGAVRFYPSAVSSNTTVAIQVIVDSDHTDPLVKSRDIIIRDIPDHSGLTVGDIMGPTSLNETSSATYSILAEGDDGITYSWTCSPSEVGTLSPNGSAGTTLTASEVSADTQVVISVEVSSEHYGPETRTLDVTIIDTGQQTHLDVSQIQGPSTVYENSTETYSVTATGDTGITYEWTCEPPAAGALDDPASATTGFTAAEVSEDLQALIQVTVDSDNCDPIVRTLDITVYDVPPGPFLQVGDIEGPAALYEYDSGTYSVIASGDTGIAYQWSCDPPTAGDFDSPSAPGTGFTAAEVGEDTEVAIRVSVVSDNCDPVDRTLDMTIQNYQLEAGEISGPAAVTENTWANYSIQAAGDSGITYEWMCLPEGAGDFYTPDQSSTGFRPYYVSEDTGVQIVVEMYSDHDGPVQKSISVTVENAPRSGWAQTWGGADWEVGYATDVDDYGNVYVAGSFRGVADFDPGEWIENRSSNGEADAFLAKFDPSGALDWALTWGGTGEDVAYDVDADAYGSVYVAGCFEGAVDFDPGTATETHTGGGGFLSKFNTLGEHQWAQTWLAECAGVGVDGLGDVYVTGGFEGTVDFQPGAGTDEHTSAGDKDVFLSKYDSSGIFQWAITWGGTSYDRGEAVTQGEYGNIYVVGGFSLDAVDFDPGPGTDEHSSNGDHDAFLSKFDSDGVFQWASTWGGDGGAWQYDWAWDVATSDFGEIYATGVFYETCDFDPGPSPDIYTAHGEGDAYVCKYSAAGEYQWVRTWGGMMESAFNPDDGRGVAVDGAGNVYITGYFWYTADFDLTPTSDEHTSNGECDVFLSKFNSSGEFQWAQTWGGLDSDQGFSVAADLSGNAYVTGFFEGAVDFDPGEDADPHTSEGGRDVFVSMFPPTGEW